MEKNIVAIDPSLISTAVAVGTGGEPAMLNYCRESSACGKAGMKKWFKMAEELVSYRFIEYREYEGYSKGEITKLVDYDRITDGVVADILERIDTSLPTSVGIEGFSFASSAGDIIDLVTFSTLLRKKLFDMVSEDITVLSPATLKLGACKLAYEPIVTETGKKKKTQKVEYRNKLGIPGGSFTKKDMFVSIVENGGAQDRWARHCRQVSGDILSVASIPKPYEDVCDSWILYQVMRAGI